MSEYYIVDFGVNYAKYSSEKLEKLLKDSWDNGVERQVFISNSMKEAHLMQKLSKKFDSMYYTLGVHPHNASQFKLEDLKFIESQKDEKKFIAIGECGLDYNRMFSTKEAQIYAFEQQIIIAKKLNKKLYIHCRDAYDDTINIIKKHQYFNGIVHCFTGSVIQALELTKLNFKLGITGWLLDKRRNKDLVETVSHPEISIDMLLIETDAPYMPIYPKKESVSSDLWIVIEEIAKLKKLPINFVGTTLYNNSIKFMLL